MFSLYLNKALHSCLYVPMILFVALMAGFVFVCAFVFSELFLGNMRVSKHFYAFSH